MLSILKTVLILCVFFVQLSSSAAIKRHGPQKWHPGYSRPWWGPPPPPPPYLPWAPFYHTYSHSVAIPISTSTFSSTVAVFTLLSTPTVIATSSSSSTRTGLPPALTSPITASTASSIVVLPPTFADGDPTGLSLVAGPTSTTEQSSVPTPTNSSTATVVPLPSKSSSISQPATSTSNAQSAPTSVGVFWKPTVGTTWQIELSGTISDLTYPVDVFDVDLFDTPSSTIKTLQQNGKKVICYFSAGSFEDWRPDRDSFQASDKGSGLKGWAGEYWLKTDSPNVRSIMTTRIQMAQDKGCDGVDPDNVDGYDNDNGLDLTQATAVDYLKFMANEAHSRGLSIGLKNAAAIVDAVLPVTEWQVNEQCAQYGECDKFRPFVDSNKPVFHIEYPDGAPSITPDIKVTTCNTPSAKGFSTVLKTIDLNAWVDPC